MTKRIYLDHAATTPMRPEAVAAVVEGMARWANPSSPHAEGRAARAALEDARARIKAALGWEGELIFTSGVSEALAIGLGRAKAERRLVSAVEHDAVFRAAPGANILPILDGEADREFLADYLARPGRSIVAIQSINPETGTIILPSYEGVEAIELIRNAGAILLSDCAQSAGKYSLPDADMIVVSAHKLGGPPGIGALLIRDFGLLEPQGGQEFGYRTGTENLPGVLGFAAAVEAATRHDLAEEAELHGLRYNLTLAEPRIERIVSPGLQCGHISAVTMPGLSAAAQLVQFDSRGFAISAGSACSSGTLKPSRVLAAFGVDPEVASRTIRVSTGWSTTSEEIEAFIDAWQEIAEHAKANA